MVIQIMRHEENYLGYALVVQESKLLKGTFEGRAWAQGEKLCAAGPTMAEVLHDLKSQMTPGGAKNPIPWATSDRVVATANTVNRVFHQPSCSRMSNVSAMNEIRFTDRNTAKKQGYSSCARCKP